MATIIDQLRAEIDRRYQEYRAKMKTDDFTYYEGMADSLDLLEQFLDTLQEPSCNTCTNDKGCVTCKDGELWEGREQPSEDLENAAFDYAKSCQYEGADHLLCAEHFRAGAEWQAERLLKGSPMPEDTVLFNKGVAEGRRLERQDMLKDAVVAYVNIYENVPGGSYVELVADISAAHFKKKEGVKILILREDKK